MRACVICGKHARRITDCIRREFFDHIESIRYVFADKLFDALQNDCPEWTPVVTVLNSALADVMQMRATRFEICVTNVSQKTKYLYAHSRCVYGMQYLISLAGTGAPIQTRGFRSNEHIMSFRRVFAEYARAKTVAERLVIAAHLTHYASLGIYKRPSRVITPFSIPSPEELAAWQSLTM